MKSMKKRTEKKMQIREFKMTLRLKYRNKNIKTHKNTKQREDKLAAWKAKIK